MGLLWGFYGTRMFARESCFGFSVLASGLAKLVTEFFVVRVPFREALLLLITARGEAICGLVTFLVWAPGQDKVIEIS